MRFDVPPLRSVISVGGLALLIGAAAPLAAQQEGPLSTDRPGFGTGTATVGRFQTEGGYSFAGAGEIRASTFGELLLRFPLAAATELRLGLNSFVIQEGPGEDATGFQDVAVGIKATLVRGAERFDPLRPAVALLASTTLPTGEAAIGAESLQPTALLALGWTLGGGFGFAADVNTSWLDAGEDRVFEVAGGVSLSCSLTGLLGSYAELYGFTPEGGPGRTFLDGGFTYLLSDDLQLDLSGGMGLSAAADDFFVGFGLSRRW